MNYDLLLLLVIFFHSFLNSKLYSTYDTTMLFGIRLPTMLIQVWEAFLARNGLTSWVNLGYLTGIAALLSNSWRMYTGILLLGIYQSSCTFPGPFLSIIAITLLHKLLIDYSLCIPLTYNFSWFSSCVGCEWTPLQFHHTCLLIGIARYYHLQKLHWREEERERERESSYIQPKSDLNPRQCEKHEFVAREYAI